MNWKKPTSKFFFVPVPYTGQFLFNLTEYRRNPEIAHTTIELTDTATKQPYSCKIWDYLIYDVNAIPDWLARECTDIENLTGAGFTALLQKKLPEFKKTEIVCFYQLSTI